MVNLHSFSGLDSLILGKKQTLEQLAEEKRLNIQSKSELATVVAKPDSDSMTVRDQYGLLQEIRSEFFDSPDRPELGGSKIRRQKIAYAAQFGVDVDQVTDEDLITWGKNVSAETAKMHFNVGDEVRYTPTGEKSKLAGDDRIISKIYNKDLDQLSELTNTGALNTAVAAPWNQQRLIEANRLKTELRQAKDPGYKSGYDEDGDAIAVQQVDGTVTYGDRDNLRGNNIPQVKSEEKSNIGNWGKPGDIFLNTLAKTVANTFDVAKPILRQVMAIGNGRMSNSLSVTDLIDGHNNIAEVADPSAVITDEQEALFNDIINRGEDTNLNTEEQQFWNSTSGTLLQNMHNTVLANIEDAKAINKVANNFRKTIHAGGLDAKIKKQYDKDFEKDGFFAASANMLIDNPLYAIEELAASLPVMLAAMTAPGLVSMFNQKAEDAILERTQDSNDPLSREDINEVRVGAAVATLFERVGAEIVLKKLPGIDKLTIGLYKQFPLLNHILAPATKVVTAAVFEGGAEAATSVGEQFAGGKDLNPADIGHAAAIGIGGGGGVKAPGAVIDLVRGQTPVVKAKRDAVLREMFTPETMAGTAEGVPLQARIDEINKALGETPGDHPNVIRLTKEREELQKQLDVANPEAISEERHVELSKELEELDAALPKEEVKPSEDAPTSSVQEEDTGVPKVEVSKEVFDAKITESQTGTLQEAVAALSALANGKLEDDQLDALDAARVALRERAGKTPTEEVEHSSLQPVNKQDPAKIKTALENAETEEDVAHFNNILNAIEGEAALTERDPKVKKDTKEVSDDIKNGVTDQWTGFQTYVERIAEITENEADLDNRDGQIKAVENQMKTHLDNMKAKLAAFTKARATTPPAGMVMVVKGTRKDPESQDRTMEYAIEPMLEADFKAERTKTGYATLITEEVSSGLIENIEQEVAFGESMFAMVNGHKDTSFVKAARNQVLEARQLELDFDALDAQQVNTTTAPLSKADIDNLDVEQSTPEKEDTNDDQPESTNTPEAPTPVSGDTSASSTAAPSTPDGEAATKDSKPGIQETSKEDDAENAEQLSEEEGINRGEATPPVEEISEQADEAPAPKVGKPKGSKVAAAIKAGTAPVVDFIAGSALPFITAAFGKAGSVLRQSKLAGLSLPELIKFKSNNGIQNIPTAAFDTEVALVAALVELKMSPAGAAILAKAFKGFNKRYKKLTLKAPDNAEGHALKKAFTMLYTMDGKTSNYEAPPQVVFALMLGNMAWVNQNPLNNALQQKHEQERFMYGSQGGRLSRTEQNQIADLGHSYILSANGVGAHVASLLNISAATAETEIYKANLVTALGIVAMQVNNGTYYDLLAHRWNFGDAPYVEGRSFNTATAPDPITGKSKHTKPVFRHIFMKENIKFSEAGATTLDEAETIFGKATEYENNYPMQKIPTHVVDAIRGTFGGIPKKTRSVLKKLQKTVWTSSDSFTGAAMLQEQHMATLYNLVGVVDIPHGTHPAARERLEAQNQDKIDTLNLLFEAKKDGYLEKFFFKYNLMNQNRIMMEGRLNPQSSHITRYLVKPFDTATYTKENIHEFKLAVVANLGYKVDKHIDAPESNGAKSEIEQIPAANILATFDALILDTNIIAAVDALKTGDIATLAEELDIIKRRFGGDLSILTAITALVEYGDGTATSFKSDITMEIDGITNGFAMNILQFPMFGNDGTLKKRLNQTGTYFGVTTDPVTHLVDGIFRTGKQPDVYLDLQNAVIQATESKDSVEQTRNAALNRLFPEIMDPSARDIVKTAFMVFMYGGGVASITRDIAKDIIADLYIQLGDIQREYNATADFPSVFRDQKVKDFEADLLTLGAKPSRKIRKAIVHNTSTSLLDGKELTFNEESMTVLIGGLLKPRFKAGLNSILGGTVDARNAVIQAGEVMHAVFMQHYEKAVAEAMADVGGRNLAPSEIRKLVSGENLRKWLPQYEGPLNEDGEKIFVDLSKQITDELVKDTLDDVVYDYADPNGKNGRSSTSNGLPAKRFARPGVSALIRGIINMDASLMTLALDSNPQVLSLYDAVMGRPGDLTAISKGYGENYLKLGMNHSVMESMRLQMQKVIDDTRALDAKNGTNLMAAAEAWVTKNSHDKKATYASAVAKVHGNAAAVLEARKNLRSLGEMTSNQLYKPDTAVVDPNSAPSYDERKADIQDKLNLAKQAVYLAQEKLKELPAVTSKILDDLFESEGAVDALKMLKEITPTNIGLFIKIARSNTENRATERVLREIGEMFKSEIQDKNISTSAAKILASLLGGTNTNSAELAEKYRARGKDKLIARVKAELDVYTHSLEFIESESAFNADIQVLRDELLSLEHLRRENPKPTLAGDLDLSNIQTLLAKFKALSRGYHSSDAAHEAHSSVLQRTVNTLAKGLENAARIKISVEQIDGPTQGSYNTRRNKLRVSMSRQPPASANGQSPEEVYVHELTHALTVTALRENPIVRNTLEKLYKRTKKDIDANGKHEIFLNGIPKADWSAKDIEMAEAQYDYLFDNSKGEANRLAEFLAYSVSNKALVTHLESISKEQRTRSEGLAGLFARAIEIVADAFARAMGNKAQANAHMDVMVILEQLMQIQSKNETIASRMANKIVAKSDVYDEKIREVLQRQAERLIKADTTSKLRKVSNSVIGGAALHMSENAVSAQVLRKVHTIMGATVMSIAGEMGDGVLTSPLIKQLLQVRNASAKARQDTERDYLDWFNNKIWKSTTGKDINVETKNALTNVMLRTQISSLLRVKINGTKISASDINNLIGNTTAAADLRKNLRAALLTKMGLKEADRAIEYATELGHFMANGETYLPDAHQNPASIIRSEIAAKDRQEHPTMLPDLQAYVSLIALGATDAREISMVKELSTNEFEKDGANNGIIDILDAHASFTQSSVEELFGNNPMQTQSGWIVERVDNLHSMVTGGSSAKEMKQKKQGSYSQHVPLGDIPGLDTPHDTLYVSRQMPEVRYVSGIFSNTGQHTKGTTIAEMLADDPKYRDPVTDKINWKKIRKTIKGVAKEQARAARSLNRDDRLKLRPVRDDSGNIVDYRVIMDHKTKKELLSPDLEFQNVFAHMQSNFVDKKNSIITDKHTVDELVREQQTLLETIPERFIDIMDSESKYKEQYRRLPKEVRDYMQQYMIDGTFMVRDSIVNKVFGFQAKSLSNIDFLQKDSRAMAKWATRMGQHIVTSFVSYGVDRIVVATTAVIAGNIMSNNFQLMMRKIGPVYIARKTLEGFQEYQVYQKDADRLRELNRQIKIKDLSDASPEKQEAIATFIRMQNNKMHKMSEAGLNSLIVEDLNEASTKGYLDRAQKVMNSDKFTKYTNNFAANAIGTAAKTVFMTSSSAPYRVSKKAVALSDFLARYVMIEHAMEVKGESFEQAMFEAVDAFVLFDENLDPNIDALSSVAGVLFASYFMRNHRAVKQLVKKHPTYVAASAGLQHILDIQTLANMNSSLYMGNIVSNLQLDDLGVTAATTTLPGNIADGLDELPIF